MTIEGWRAEINQLDAELLRLLNKRARLALQVGESKTASGLSLCDHTREREVIERMCEANEGPLDERAIVELLSGRSFTAAARKAGINERTLRKWASEDDDFKAELRAAQTALFEAGMSRVLGMTTRAVDTLADLLDQGQPPTVRLGAARSILELGVHKHDADDIEKRLGEIETYARQQATGRP